MPTIQFRRGTEQEWSSANPVLAAGEPGFEVDTGRQKIGDGVSRWEALPYFVAGFRDGQSATGDGEIRRIVVTTQYAYEQSDRDPGTLYVIRD